MSDRLENVNTLHLELIRHAAASFRLLFIHVESSFADFRPSEESFCDLSPGQCCAIFLNDVLPKLHSYPLIRELRNRLRLIQLHPDFERTPQGYQYKPKHVDDSFVLKPNEDFSSVKRLPDLIKASAECRQETVLPLTGRKASHTIFVDQDAEPNTCPKFQLSFEISAQLSAMLSTDLELSSAQLFSTTELKTRLQRAKQNFQDHGQVLPYRDNWQQITNNIDTFDKLQTGLSRTLSTIFK